MNFADLEFWGFLFIALFVALGLRLIISRIHAAEIGTFDRWSLAAIGIFLLGCVSFQSLGIFVVVSVVTYLGLRLILHLVKAPSRRALWLWVLIPLQLLPLIYYKYADFLGNDIFGLGQKGFAHIAIPVGISFYTFQLISFTVDTLKHEQPLPDALTTINFAGFFPQIVAGPIERREALLPQLEKFRFRWNKEAIEEGLTWIVLGLFFKRCLADNLALMPLIHEGTNAYLIWLDTVMFGFRIYFDFCGYSLMALGVAQCLGIKLTLNFRSPYCAKNITDFWRRWHVTLSSWFRDYIYIPMGGSRTGFWAVNILVVFIVSGIWHGAGWNFIIWGALHGSYLIFHRFSGRLSVPFWLGYAVTQLGVFFAWLCFYETNSERLFEKMTLLLSPSAYGIEPMKLFIKQMASPGGFSIAVIGMITLAVVILEAISLREEKTVPYRFLRGKGVLCLMVILTVILPPTAANEFIYFAF